jgi:hypothetical protein
VRTNNPAADLLIKAEQQTASLIEKIHTDPYRGTLSTGILPSLREILELIIRARFQTKSGGNL